MSGSIRNRLLAGTAIAVSLAFLAAGILVLVLTRSALRAQLDDALIAKAHAASALIEQEGDVLESELGETPELATPGESYEVWDARMSVIARSSGLAGHLEPAPTRTIGDLILTDVALPGGHHGRQVTLRFQPRAEPEDLEGHPRQLATIAIARSFADVDDAVGRIGRVLLGVGVGGTFVCLLVLAWVVRFGLSPLRSLATAIAEIREGDLDARLATATTPGELRPVVDRLNDLLARLGVAFTRERELTAEVAHELRTPLAGLRATIEVALGRDRSADKYRGALTDCLAICTQTERVVEMLLSLSRLDAGMVAAASESVEVDELVREVLAPLSTRVVERRLELTTELPPVTLMTDREKLRMILHNLVENAVSYANEGGAIRIELSPSAIRISNTGCELAPDQIEHVFERFWRGDAARTTGTHAGLGLSLCRKLAELLGARIDVEVTAGRFVATFVLRQGA